MYRLFPLHKKRLRFALRATQPFFLLRDSNCKFRLAAAAFRCDFPTVEMYDTFNDCKSDAIALAGMGFISLIEFIEDIRQALRRNIGPGVRNMDLNLVILVFD